MNWISSQQDLGHFGHWKAAVTVQYDVEFYWTWSSVKKQSGYCEETRQILRKTMGNHWPPAGKKLWILTTFNDQNSAMACTSSRWSKSEAIGLQGSENGVGWFRHPKQLELPADPRPTPPGTSGYRETETIILFLLNPLERYQFWVARKFWNNSLHEPQILKGNECPIEVGGRDMVVSE